MYGGDEGGKQYIRKKELWEKGIEGFTRENIAAIWANFVTIVAITQEIISWSSSN